MTHGSRNDNPDKFASACERSLLDVSLFEQEAELSHRDARRSISVHVQLNLNLVYGLLQQPVKLS